MAHFSPPASPGPNIPRPPSAIARAANRSSSRLSMSGVASGGPAKNAGVSGSRLSDEESRTAVNVAVRVRPPLQPTDPGYDLIPQRFQRSMVQTNSHTNLTIDSPQGRKLFVFDRVFDSDVTQDGMWDYLSDSVNSFTQGYNVSVLAYGQSGAGKSYTMGTSGPDEQYEQETMGVIPRAAAALFEHLEASNGSNTPRSSNKSNRNSMSHLRTPRGHAQQNALGDQNWSLKATYVEIYNEQLRDLLVPESTPLNERNNVAIREDVKGNILLTGLRQVEINSVEDLMSALNFGSTIRQTDATAINAKSSRSHAVFSLNLVQRKKKTTSAAEKRFSVPLEAMSGSQELSITTDSKLHFVDLAGSERLKNTGAHGDRAKEGISINAGLAALGKVISQLSSRQSGSHVSYRDSRLTRLLQDSLGGNAITYMIACVTPAEFHLSETLNTVQYAQRARAIQSKPRIQQIEEGDKQAIIDRLKAEVAFLREQASSQANRDGASPRRLNVGSIDRSDRQNEREVELQNQLLDSQENYNALGNRHAKLIAELARAREDESTAHNQLDDAQGDNATDRLNRSNSFAQAVEQVVLEYEKTIQSLEQSLSSTRGTLSTTEASLLEKETKCAYSETITTQLQARLQKLMEREASTENYLHDLETKLDGHTTGEEKSSTIIMELRKEATRARENEASCEDYISTLEERLAESDQDSELMQREIDRLEQVVERQRSLGKLDSLLHELDHVNAKQPEQPEVVTNGASRRASHSRVQSHVSRPSFAEASIPEEHEEGETREPVITTVKEEAEDEDPTAAKDIKSEQPLTNGDYTSQSPAQSKYVADKLDTVTQELIGLRVDHESTVNQFDALHVEYEKALRTIAELQDSIDEARRPDSNNRKRESVMSGWGADAQPEFLSEKSNAPSVGPRSSATRSLSSELSFATDSPATAGTTNGDNTDDDETATAKAGVSTDDLTEAREVVEPVKPVLAVQTSVADEQNDQLAAEITRLKTLAEEKELAEKELAERYAQLESEHSEALDMVAELKTEVTKVRAVEATSPRIASPIVRRKSSQNLLGVDRAHRSFASLRNIAADNFENNPELMQSFEININAAVHELHMRTERIQQLEAEIGSSKREMETKMTIISGLTRERSSLSASPREMPMVANLRDQLEQNERQLTEMREAHIQREQSLSAELETLRQAMAESGPGKESARDMTSSQGSDQSLSQLQAELADWEGKHKSVIDTMETKQTEMRNTIGQLEAEIEAASAKLTEAQATSTAVQAGGRDEADEKQTNMINFLRSEIDEYKAIINSNATKVAELESAHSTARAELDDMNKAHDIAKTEASLHQDMVSQLEQQMNALEQATKSHQDGMALLKMNHAKELDELKVHEQKGYEEQAEILMTEHHESVSRLETELSGARDELMRVATQVATALGVEASTEALGERIENLAAAQHALTEERKKRGELESHVSELTSINDTIMRDLESAKGALAEMVPQAGTRTSVIEAVSAVKSKLTDLEGRNKKNSRLVEELEEQLQNNYDEAQATNNRLSTLQSERKSQMEDITSSRHVISAELETIREDYANLQAKYDEVVEVNRSNSNSAVRKSASHVSLPSPPPAIPLPPLPNGAQTPGSPHTNGANSPTNMRPASKDNMHNISQITEDQEARIRTIEKHLYAERQLTQTLEEALTDLEKQSNKVKADCDAWKKRAGDLETENKDLKDRSRSETPQDNRWSVQAVEEERKKRQAAEAAKRQLEERMNAINKGKKKKGSLNCF